MRNSGITLKIRNWCFDNYLNLILDKTKLMVYGSPHLLSLAVPDVRLSLMGKELLLAKVVKDFGVIFYPNFTFFFLVFRVYITFKSFICTQFSICIVVCISVMVICIVWFLYVIVLRAPISDNRQLFASGVILRRYKSIKVLLLL